MPKMITLTIDDPKVKAAFFKLLSEQVLIPVCKNCGKLFALGFPGNENGMADRLICEENHMVCECEHANIVRKLYSSSKDGLVDIMPYYTTNRLRRG